jgi:hypothetical protein
MNNIQNATIFKNKTGFGAVLTGDTNNKFPFKSFNQARAWLSFMTGDWHSKVKFVNVQS